MIDVAQIDGEVASRTARAERLEAAAAVERRAIDALLKVREFYPASEPGAPSGHEMVVAPETGEAPEEDAPRSLSLFDLQRQGREVRVRLVTVAPSASQAGPARPGTVWEAVEAHHQPVREDTAEGRLLAWLRQQREPMTSVAADLALQTTNASSLLSSLFAKGAVERSKERSGAHFLYRVAGPGLELALPRPAPAWLRARETPRRDSPGPLAVQLLELVRGAGGPVTCCHPALASWQGKSVSATLADLWQAGLLERRPARPRGFEYRPVVAKLDGVAHTG